MNLIAGPVFEEFQPGAACPCPGCAAERAPAAPAGTRRRRGRTGASGVRAVLAVAAAATSVLGAAPLAPPASAAPEPPRVTARDTRPDAEGGTEAKGANGRGAPGPAARRGATGPDEAQARREAGGTRDGAAGAPALGRGATGPDEAEARREAGGTRDGAAGAPALGRGATGPDEAKARREAGGTRDGAAGAPALGRGATGPDEAKARREAGGARDGAAGAPAFGRGATGPAETQARRHAGFATAPREVRQGTPATASRSAALVRPAAAPREPSATQEGEHPGGYGDPDDPSGGPRTPQGSSQPLHPGGGGGAASPGTVTRGEIIDRARTWLAAKVPYSMSAYHDGYRQDCSGFISMAWDLRSNQWTGSLASFGERITKDELQPGDMLLFHNPQDPENGSHVTLFGGWADAAHTKYTAYEQTPPRTRSLTTPYAYWTNSAQYVPYRPKNLASGSAGPRSSAFPGAAAFGPGKRGPHVTRLGEMLVARGAGRYYKIGPGPRWTEADRRATAAFQRAQGWRGAGADGLPGPRTWQYLVSGKGRDVR